MLGSGTDLARSDRVRAATAPATPLSWTRTAVAADDVGTRVWDVPGYGARDGILAIQTQLPTDPPAFSPRTFHRMSGPWSTFWEMLAALTLDEKVVRMHSLSTPRRAFNRRPAAALTGGVAHCSCVGGEGAGTQSS